MQRRIRKYHKTSKCIHKKKKFLSIRNKRQNKFNFLDETLVSLVYGLPQLNENDIFFRKRLNGIDPLLNRGETTEVFLEEAYFRASVILMESCRKSRYHNVKDGLYYPAMNCFRQYMENTMKSSWILYRLAKGIKTQKNDLKNFGHDLTKIWNELKVYICGVTTSDIAFGKILEEFDTLGLGNTYFRYQYKLENIEEPAFQAVDIDNILKRMKQIYVLLDGIDSDANEKYSSIQKNMNSSSLQVR